MLYPGKVWVSFDWAQAEPYFLALFSGDVRLAEALSTGDLHTTTARWTFDLDGEVSSDLRELAKLETYSLIYSGFDLRCAQNTLISTGVNFPVATVRSGLKRFVEVYSRLYEWAIESALKWFKNGGTVSYFLNAKRNIPVPGWLQPIPDKMLSNTNCRIAINSYGQQSVGLLLKAVLHHMKNSELVREHVSNIIPIFDALYFLVDVKFLQEVIAEVDYFATPVLKFDGRSIRMRTDWKLSQTSWGDLRKIKLDSNDLLINNKYHIPQVYEWRETFDAISSGSVNPFGGGSGGSQGVSSCGGTGSVLEDFKSGEPINPLDFI